MASWTNVPNSVLEPGDPIRSVDIIAIKDNIEHYAENNGTTTVFTSPGTWTKPATVKRIKVTVVGGGGGGGGNTGGYGGGGGGAIEWIPAPSIPGPVAVTRGAAGNGSPNSGTGGTGGTSSFGAFLSATGGTGAKSAGAGGAGGNGGSGSGGNLNFVGGRGTSALSSYPGPGNERLSIERGGGTILATFGAHRGQNGYTYGGGGGSGNGLQVGRPGGTGVVIVEEFY